MKTRIKDGKLLIEIPLAEPTPSKSGKTLIISSTHGPVRTGVEIEGKEIVVNLNAYIKK